MPGMNGVEFYAYISEKQPALKNRIIIITGDVMGLDIKAFLAHNNCLLWQAIRYQVTKKANCRCY